MRVRRLLVGAPLPCGCLAGIYEARNGSIVRLIDVRGDRCTDRAHDVDHRLEMAGINRDRAGLQEWNRERRVM